MGIEGLGNPAKPSRSSVALPHYEWVSDTEAFEPGMLAVWQANHPKYPNGVILLNRNHPVIKNVISERCAEHADHQQETVKKIVTQCYGEIAVAKVAHTEYLKPLVNDAKIVEDEMRSSAALTMALLGLMSEDSLITRRLASALSKKRKSST